MNSPYIKNSKTLSKQFVDNTDPLVSTAYLSMACGSKDLVVNIDTVLPGAKSCKYHCHSLKEEFFLVLEGKGRIRINDEFLDVKEGDCIAKLANTGMSHQFINTSKDVLKILDISVNCPLDIVLYPDEDVEFHGEKKKAYKKGILLDGWSSRPDQSLD